MSTFENFVAEMAPGDEFQKTRALAIGLHKIKHDSPSRQQWSIKIEKIGQTRLRSKATPDDAYFGSVEFIRLRFCECGLSSLIPIFGNSWDWEWYEDACRLIIGFDGKLR